MLDLFGWSGREHDAVGLQALSVTSPQLSFGVPGFIDQETTQSISSWSTLPKSILDEPALSGKNFDREFPTILASHNTFDAFEQDRAYGAIVIKLLATILQRTPELSSPAITRLTLLSRTEPMVPSLSNCSPQ